MIASNCARQLLSESALKSLRSKRNAWRARRRAYLRKKLIRRHGTFTAAELVSFCRDAGIRSNGILFVQCSYNDLLTYRGSPYELLGALLELVGPQGTLFMPAYTTNMSEIPCRPFDLQREPTYTGIIPELFRREEGVIRSLHPRHSICGLGPRAAELLEGHENCPYADGPDSPFDRLRKLHAQCLCLGIPATPGLAAFLHWVEDIEPEKYPGKVHDGPYDCVLRTATGDEILRPFYGRRNYRRNRGHLLAKHLGEEAMRPLEFHGISHCIYSLPAFAEELLALRDRGLVWLEY